MTRRLGSGKLVIATHNAGKLKEIGALLDPYGVTCISAGSLGLGGAIAALAVMTQTEVLLLIIGGIFVIEALSVVIQVFAFQRFRRRVFLMAPLHHHFEMLGWSETKIILRFWIVAAICSAIGFTLYQASI